jgi:hypothetical protein
VHEQNVDYCSTQSLPNCVGWLIFNVTMSPGAPAVTPQAAFTQWYTATRAGYGAIAARRAAAIDAAVAAAAAGGEAQSVAAAARALRGSDEAEAAADAAVAAARVQIVDPVTWPNNPSCPFPTPKPVPAAAQRSRRV